MSLKQLLIIVLSATVIFFISWLFILFEVDPTSSGWVGLLVFYASSFFTLLGALFALVVVVRKWRNKNELEYEIVSLSVRQALFFSLTIIGVLFLQSKRFLTWWNLLILILAVTLLEYLFLSLKRKPIEKSEPATPPPYIPPDF
jgi:hypothetical protein